MGLLDDYKFGRVYDKEIPVEAAEEFSTLFGEGSPSLTKLIKYTIENRIKTLASCKGHPEKENILDRIFSNGYISFVIDDDNYDFAYYLASIPITNKGMYAMIDCTKYNVVTIHVPAYKKDLSEKYFDIILNKIKEYQRIKENKIPIEYNEEVSKIVDYSFSRPSSDEIFEISSKGYKKIIQNGFYIKTISKCPIGKKTNLLHRIVNESLEKEEKIDKFIKDR